MVDEVSVARFWAQVDTSGGDDACWSWKGKLHPDGYGYMNIRGLKSTGAHRIAYLLSKGSIASGLVVRHRCNNRPCCNPAHLLAGTQRENVLDMYASGYRRKKT